ncbi:MAG TPA: DUF3034 family protein [Steroidobacteraceae bacterium]
MTITTRTRWGYGTRAGLAALSLAGAPALVAAGDRLLATGGVMQIEGSAGGGLTPWALISGLGTDTEVGASGYCTQVKTQDFRLDSCGASVGIENRVELSLARQSFNLGAVIQGQKIDQTIVGAKVRLYGDLVVDQDRPWPQLALGLQWKRNSDFDLVPSALGAKHAAGTDFYLAATKLWLDGPLGRSWLADLTLRASDANQLGILGFGGDRGGYHLLAEASLGVFVSDNLVLGGEYRQKPSNLSAFREDDFKDLFLSFIPLKYVSLTLAYVDLGNIADKPHQHGSYVSLQGSW